jgi:hypothetical protein
LQLGASSNDPRVKRRPETHLKGAASDSLNLASGYAARCGHLETQKSPRAPKRGVEESRSRRHFRPTASLTSRAARGIFVRQSPRSRRVEDTRSRGHFRPTASLTSRAARDIFVRQSPRSRRVKESGALSTDGESDESRRVVTSFRPTQPDRVGRVGRVGPPPTPHVCLTSRTLSGRQVATHESSRATRRIPLPPRVAARGVEESEATRRAAAKKGESTVALCRSDASTRGYDSTI